MDVLLVASEFAPWVQKSNVAEAVASFSKTLKQVGHTVSVVMPYSAAFEQAGLLLARRLSKLKPGQGSECTVYDAQLTSGVQLVLIQIETDSTCADSATFIVQFAQAVAALVSERGNLGVRADVVHCHDLLGSLVPVCLRQLDGLQPPTVFTIYDNLGQPWSASSAQASELGPFASLPELTLDGALNLLACAVRTAKVVTIPSLTHVRLLSDSAHHGQIANELASLSPPLTGIPRGIDYARANPASDSQLVARYDAENFLAKGTCKTALQRQLGLDINPECPLLFVAVPHRDKLQRHVARSVLAKLLDYSISVVIGCQSDVDAESSGIVELSNQWPKRIALLPTPIGEVDTVALSAADFAWFSNPQSILESNHLFALRYGCVPIAQPVGTYADHLIDCDAKLQTGNCFSFEACETDLVLGAISRAVTAYGQSGFVHLRRRIMRQDLGLERPTRRMVQVYRQALGISM